MNTLGSFFATPGPVTAPRIVSAAALIVALALSALAGLSTQACAQDPDGAKRLVPVPTAGIEVEFWSDPPAGSLVHAGSQARLYARTNADCYLTVFSVDTEGRMQLLYPRPFEDGWIAGGRTYRLPEPGSGYNLRFTGPPGMEYVYVLASFHPLHSRYPSWMTTGLPSMPPLDDWNDAADSYRTGRVVGDPFYQVRDFCEELVPYPEQRDSYATAWVYFHLGRRVPYPRFLCSDCHSSGAVDPYGSACPAVRVRVGDVRCSGYIDFRLAWLPRYSYEVWTGWRPRTWHGDRWNGPDGRWVWSSADGRRVLGGHFSDARPPGHRPTTPWDPDVRRDDRRGDGRGDSGGGRSGRVVRPQRSQNDNAWGRGFDERLRRAIGEKEERRDPGDRTAPARPREPELRNVDPRSGVPSPKPPAPPDRGDRGRESRRAKDSAPRSPDRPPKEGQGRSR